MRLFASFGFAFAAAAAAATGDGRADAPERSAERAEEITVVEPHKSYVVKLGCLGCPFAVREGRNASWEHPPRDNALLLKFDIDASSLLLNGHSILPLGAMPLEINALQVPADISKGVIAQPLDGDVSSSSSSLATAYPLQYEHTLLRTEVHNKFWVQFDVTGLPSGETMESVKMDKEGQKIVEILMGKPENSTELLIETVQVAERKNRARPFRMKCGRLAMIQTSYDPNEWDEYGKLGTWSRTWNMWMSKLGGFMSGSLEHNAILLPLALSLAFSIVMARRWYQHRQHVRVDEEEEMEVALLGSYYEDAPPAYANIPVIKIEECD